MSARCSALSRWLRASADGRGSSLQRLRPCPPVHSRGRGLQRCRNDPEAISLDTIQGDVTNLGHLIDELVKQDQRPRLCEAETAAETANSIASQRWHGLPAVSPTTSTTISARTRDRPEGDADMKTAVRVDDLGHAGDEVRATSTRSAASNGLKRTDDIAALDLLASKALEEVVEGSGGGRQHRGGTDEHARPTDRRLSRHPGGLSGDRRSGSAKRRALAGLRGRQTTRSRSTHARA